VGRREKTGEEKLYRFSQRIVQAVGISVSDKTMKQLRIDL
jgi:hypothetical protein